MKRTLCMLVCTAFAMLLVGDITAKLDVTVLTPLS